MEILEQLLKEAHSLVRPPPKLSVSEWADTYRKLSAEASSEPGQWLTDRAPYQRGIMDAISDPDIHTIVVKSSAQVGKTEIILNAIGYYAHQDPSPILLLQPTLEMAETFSKDRLAPMIRDTKHLAERFPSPKSKGSGNTLRHKIFSGGHITMAGANSPASLASRPIRVCLMDEVDRYPFSAGTEGDPVNLARKRTTTFHNRKIILTSTPTIKDASRIDSAYQESDQRVYLVACPHCSDRHEMKWANVHWPEGEPHRAAYGCPECGTVWTEKDRAKAIHDGEWTQLSESLGVAGFAMSELLSPWSTPADMAVAFMAAKNNPDMLKTWVNTALGEVWDDAGEQADPASLPSFAENYDSATKRDEILMVTMGGDVQKDRVELEVVGWGYGGVPWIIDHIVIYGDTESPTNHIWNEVDKAYAATYCGHRPARLYLDSGYRSDVVYKYTKKRHGRGIFPIKGESGQKEMVSKPRQAGAIRAMLVKVGIDPIKMALLSMLKSPGEKIHFSTALDAEFYAQLTAEKAVLKAHRGFKRVEFHKTRERNEALDCFVYAYAAMIALNPNWDALEAVRIPAEEPASDEHEQESVAVRPARRQPVRQRRGGFVKRY